jgi:putative endonuclease
MPDLGELGEQLVAQWLQENGWLIVQHRWRCRWGEIDLIAQYAPIRSVGVSPNGEGTGKPIASNNSSCPILVFVEVKTRTSGNWDADGLLAITPQKQTKMRKTAQMFLAEHPQLTDFPCRFDVALVSSTRQNRQQLHRQEQEALEVGIFPRQFASVTFGQPVSVAGYQLTLHDYIQSAFD